MSGVEVLDVSQVEGSAPKGEPLLDDCVDIIKGIKVKLEVRVGSATVTVEELMKMEKDSVVQLSRLTSSPVELIFDNKVVAYGHLVAVDDNFGFRISAMNS